ncbi:DUF2946 domain-containing protein [Bombella sp. TMW 2.2559]|uniref:DUF2946 domain-containing protein n=1 Tax=Bombella dulcis TaxID=2967339 RepID=A0ABT3WBU1_9PROT|nr:DUF2946 domain-containing protein [Bombella dulcis]MCX5616536.1 DUF2946 domain-containing protein [Bombella dulcis]
MTAAPTHSLMTLSALLRWRPLRLLMGLVMLLGFGAQLLLTASTLPDESPRTAILRLTGIDIAPTAVAQPASAMPDMDHARMMQDDQPAHCLPEPSHHQVQSHHHSGGHHRHGLDCPLCPLLDHVLLALMVLAVLLSCTRLSRQVWQAAHPAQAPPEPARQRPPSRGPPPFILNHALT